MDIFRLRLPPHWTVNAVRFSPVDPWPDSVISYDGAGLKDGRYYGHVDAIAGQMWVSEGDWIVTGASGERIVLTSHAFDLIYESFEDAS